MYFTVAQLHVPSDQCLAPAPVPDTASEVSLHVEVVEVKERERGFYSAGQRTYYVSKSGNVFCIRGPAGAAYDRLDDLPADATVDRDAPADNILWRLAEVAEMDRKVGP